MRKPPRFWENMFARRGFGRQKDKKPAAVRKTRLMAFEALEPRHLLTGAASGTRRKAAEPALAEAPCGTPPAPSGTTSRQGWTLPGPMATPRSLRASRAR